MNTESAAAPTASQRCDDARRRTPALPCIGRLLFAALLTSCGLLGFGHACAQTDQSTTPESLDPLALQWPRFINTNGYEFAVYQPQISKWPGNQLEGRFAIAVRPAGTSNETYGVVFFKTRTDIDKYSRLVTLEDFQITKMNFPTQRGMQKVYQTIIQAELPQKAKIIPLDHLEATFAVSAEVEKAKIQKVDNTPPRIIYTTVPSLLAIVDGSPILKPLVGDYERVVNTRSILLLNTNVFSHGYYLHAADTWYSAPSIEGPWTVNLAPPVGIDIALEAALATKQVDPAKPRAPITSPPVLYVTTTPTELVQCNGAPNLLTVADTDLLYVSNSDNAIFYYLDDGSYYVLISGRWFKCSSLYGPWTYVPPNALPADFKKIPPDSPKSNVLLSVAGTPQAQEAMIASTIPQTATVYRDQAKLTVDYIGAPSFVAIPGTSLFYAANTATPVIMVNAKSYYACENGIWFVSANPVGPWAVATSIPPAIYKIPVTCPIHYVTYAYVYGYTPTVVYVGYTPGYMGVIITSSGTVVYGTGYVYPPVVVGTVYVSYPPTYGSGASFAMGAAVGFAFGYAVGHSSGCYYEPHYGCYHYAYPYHYGYAGYNVNSCSQYTHWGTSVHASGSYNYNPWGTSSAHQSGTTYNPYTGTSGSFNRNASYNPYSGQGSASRSGSAYNPYSGASASGNASANIDRSSGDYNANRNVSGYNPGTGRSMSSSASASGNVYNGDYNASRSTSASGQYSGESVQNTRSVSGNVYNGTASVNNSGSAENSRTGNSASWNNGSVTADHNGNTYTSGDTSQNRSTAQSSWQSKSSSAQSSWSSRESAAQSTGSQRASSWQSSGNGGWGDRSSGSGGWGGARGGGWGGGGRRR